MQVLSSNQIAKECIHKTGKQSLHYLQYGNFQVLKDGFNPTRVMPYVLINDYLIPYQLNLQKDKV